MKRVLCLMLCVLILLSGCGGQEPVNTQSSEGSPAPETEATTAAPSAVEETEPPAAETETEAAELPEALDREGLIAYYEASPLEYSPVKREAEQSPESLPSPRYQQGEDGIWRSEAEEDQEAVLMLTGDLMCQSRQQEAAKGEEGYDFQGSFRYVRPIFAQADLVMGNLEAVFSESAPYMSELNRVEGRPHLNAPSSYLATLREAGFDLVTMSNNHNCDAGGRGVFDTLDRVEEYGLIHTGTFRGPEEPRYALVETAGIRVGILSYATYFNHKQEHLTQEGAELLLNPYSLQRAVRDLALLREAGAEYIIVYMHWGKEYSNEPEQSQYDVARELAEAGADYIVGSHPHALQPYERILCSQERVVPVLYSMGNFVSHQTRTVTKDTLILRLVLTRNEAGQVVLGEEGYIPCRVFKSFLGEDYVVVPVVEPYKQGRSSKYFLPAYQRITEILGPELEALGTP